MIGASAWLSAADAETLTQFLARVSALICALPWVRGLDFDPVQLAGGVAYVANARFVVEPRRRLQRGNPHMAIHPYPVELIAELSPAMLARYIANPDQTSAEFAIVVADAWQYRGVANMLMGRLIACARRRGLERLQGTVLRENEPMLAFVRRLGFVVEDDPEDAAQILATLALG